jgi:hypothetical protein
MVTQAERAAERRRERLEAMQRQVEDGSLTIRKMTPDELKRYSPKIVRASSRRS